MTEQDADLIRRIIREEIAAKLDSLPFIVRALEVQRQELRALKAAFNDFALTNVTEGEIRALHTDVDAVQTKTVQLEVQIATIQRQIKELREERK